MLNMLTVRQNGNAQERLIEFLLIWVVSFHLSNNMVNFLFLFSLPQFFHIVFVFSNPRFGLYGTKGIKQRKHFIIHKIFHILSFSLQ